MSDLWQRICCAFGRHAYYRIARLGVASMHVGCKHCTRQWGMNYDARALLPWSDVAQFHRETHGYPTNGENKHGV
jgi:hypothetical protein